MSKIAIDLEGKDNASRAFQTATDRLKDLRAEIDKLKSKNVDLTVADASKLNRLTSEANRLDRALGTATGTGKQSIGMLERLTGGSLTAGKALGMLGVVAGPALFLGIAKGAANAVIGLDAMREESEQISARFLAQAGSTRAAAEALSAMNTVIGGALTNDEKMAASGQLMALGLANSAQEAANLANIAINLGDKTQGTAERIAGLTQVMVSGRLVGLKAYGISMAEVNERALEMQRETAGLTAIQAKQNAILEIGTQKLNEYQAAGGTAVTATQQLQKSWEDYQDALANSVDLGKLKSWLTSEITAARINVQIESADPLDQLAGLEAKLRNIQQIRDDFEGNPIGLFFAGGGGFGAQAEIDGLIARIATLKSELGEESRWAAGAQRLTSGLQDVGGELENATTEAQKLDDALAGLKSRDVDIKVNAVAAAILAGDLNAATVAVYGLNTAFGILQLNKLGTAADFIGPQLPANFNRGLISGQTLEQQVGTSLDFIGPSPMEANTAAGQRRIAAISAAESDAERLAAANVTAAKATQSAWESAFNAIAGAAESEFGKAQDQLKGLLPEFKLDMGGLGTNAPGTNGPFEDIFRAADVAKLGGASPWAAQIAAQLNVSNEEVQAKAREAVTAFAQGLRTPEVRKLIDEAMLVDQVKQAEAAKTSLDSWGKEIAKAAGVNPNLKAGGAAVFDAAFGGDVKTGKNQAAVQTASNAVAQFGAQMGVEVAKSEFRESLNMYGERSWGYFEAGFVGEASRSGSLQAAIDAMVAAALGKRGAFTTTAGGYGVK